MRKIEHLCDVKSRTLLWSCKQYLLSTSCLLSLGILHSILSISIFLNFVLMLDTIILFMHTFCLSADWRSFPFFPFYIKGPWQTVPGYHWLKYTHLIHIVVSLKGLYTIHLSVLCQLQGYSTRRLPSTWGRAAKGRVRTPARSYRWRRRFRRRRRRVEPPTTQAVTSRSAIRPRIQPLLPLRGPRRTGPRQVPDNSGNSSSTEAPSSSE